MCQKFSWYFLQSNDLFIFFAISYSIVNLFIEWDNFTGCSRPIHGWLLAALFGILLYRLSVIIFKTDDDDDEEDLEILRINLFKTGYKTHTIVYVGVLYPLFTIWTLLGTVWYLEDTTVEPKCLSSENSMDWYFLTWIISFYAMTIIFTTIILYSAILNYRNYMLEQQFTSLLEQYNGTEAPDMRFGISGLSPEQIIKLPIENVNENDGTCSICLDTFKDLEKARVMPCSHKYHLLCIDKWLMQHSSCPLCKVECVLN